MRIRNIVGPIPEPDELFGRDDLLAHLWQQIQSNNILLLAPRRFGKSGVMRHVLLRPKTGYLALDFELEDVTSPEEFVWRVTRKLLEEEPLRLLLSRMRHLPSVCRDWVKDTFDSCEFEGAKVTFKNSIKADWREVAQHLLSEMEEAESTIIFLFDEFPTMLEKLIEHHGEKVAAEFLAWFRALRLAHKDVLRRHRFIVAGSIGVDAILRRLDAPDKLNDFKRIYVEPLSASVAMKLASDLAETLEVSWSDSLGEELLRLLGANVPFFVHLFFVELGQKPTARRRHLSQEDLRQIYRERVLGPTCRNYFEHYSARLRRYGKQGEMAAKTGLCAVANAPSGRISRSALFDVYRKARGKGANHVEFDELLGDLEHDWYLVLDPTTNEYYFKVKVMQDWWQRWYPSLRSVSRTTRQRS